MESLGGLVAFNLALACVVMVGVWMISLPLKDVSIVDIAWGAMGALLALSSFILANGSPSRKLLITAMTVVAELGDISRFDSPRQLMAYLGLVPSESSSGPNRRRGGITKTGNGHVRRILIEAAWCYRYPAKVSPEMQCRQARLP